MAAQGKKVLKRIQIQNYRSCLSTSLDLDTSLSVLIGVNGSGKTNILQAIMFLQKLAIRERFGPTPDSITVSPRLTASFEYARSSTRLRAAFDAYTDESNNDVILGSKEKWTVKYGGGKTFSTDNLLPLISRQHRFRSALSPSRSKQYYVDVRGRLVAGPPLPGDKEALDTLIATHRFCRGIKYYGASQFTNPGSCPVSFELEQDKDYSRPFRLRGHARILYDMYSAREKADDTHYSVFLDIVGQRGLKLIDDLTFRKIETSSIDYSVRVGGKLVRRRKNKILVIPQFKIGKQRLSPNQLSEGTFKTLALLFHVITADSTAMLIEEPEVCVHHGLLSSILEVIKTYSEKKLMIISTHSDLVLDHVSPENVHRVTFSEDTGTVAHNIRKTMTAREFAALRVYLRQEGNLGEYWREGGLGDRP